MSNFRVKYYDSYVAIGILSFLSVTLGFTIIEGGSTAENIVIETLGFKITVALFCGLSIIFGYFIGSRMSTDANKGNYLPVDTFRRN